MEEVKQFGYLAATITYRDNGDLNYQLNQLGAKGWEIIHIPQMTAPIPGYPYHMPYLAKMEIKNANTSQSA